VSPEVAVAVIAASGAGVAAAISSLPAYLKARKAEQHVRPNGQGTLVEMNERQLRMLGEISGQLQAHVNDERAHN
jgi:hypothetical protein